MVGQITNIAPSAGWHRSMTYYIEDNLVTCFASSFSQFNSLTRDANFWFSRVSFLLWTVSGPRPSPHRLCVSMTSIITATSSVFFNGIYLNTNLPHWVHYPQPCVLLVFCFFFTSGISWVLYLFKKRSPTGLLWLFSGCRPVRPLAASHPAT